MADHKEDCHEDRQTDSEGEGKQRMTREDPDSMEGRETDRRDTHRTEAGKSGRDADRLPDGNQALDPSRSEGKKRRRELGKLNYPKGPPLR